MTGAIEFLRKAKAICESAYTCKNCPIYNELCGVTEDIEDEADLVRKVMEYRLEDRDANKPNE